jgi:hypothetical protein
MKKQLFVPLLFLALLNCNPVIYINPTYKDGSFDKEILALDTSFVITDFSYKGNLKPEFGVGDPKLLVATFLKKKLPLDLKTLSKFSDVKACKMQLLNGYSDTVVGFGKDQSIRIRIPTPSNTLSCEDSTIRFVVFINSISIKTQIVNSSTNIGVFPGGGGGTKELYCSVKALIWDQKAKQIVCCGFAEGEAPSAVIVMDTWKDLAIALAAGIMRPTPFHLNY